MSILRETLNNISIENIEAHIQELEGIKLPIIAPEALKDEYKYIRVNLSSRGYEQEDV